MKTTFKRVALLLPVILALAGGCATSALWDKDKLDAFKQPADDLRLKLFTNAPGTDVLVVYNEFTERSSHVRLRAYWLHANGKRVQQGLAPHFADLKSVGQVGAVPVFYDPVPLGTSLPPDLCAVVSTNKQSFALYHGARLLGAYNLPSYNDGKGQVERIALTPLAVAADATIVGGVVGFYAGCYYLAGKGGWVDPQ